MARTTDSTLPRKSGIRLDTARIDWEIGRRAITQRTLAACAGIPALTMSRARRGYPVSERTVRRIAEALAKIPLAVGADALLAEPERKIAATASQNKTASTPINVEAVPPTAAGGHPHAQPEAVTP